MNEFASSIGLSLYASVTASSQDCSQLRISNKILLTSYLRLDCCFNTRIRNRISFSLLNRYLEKDIQDEYPRVITELSEILSFCLGICQVFD
jgi:hypothetical protein